MPTDPRQAQSEEEQSETRIEPVEEDTRTEIGSVPVERLIHLQQFPSSFLEPRDVIVYLPPGYQEDTHHRYPVLYLHDGQNLFDPQTAFTHGLHWHVGETTEQLIEQGAIEPLIIVGVYNTGDHRLDEYTPSHDRKLGGGDADLYGRMLVEEVKAWVDSQYRTLSDPLNTGVGGSSLGGLVSLYLGLSRPDTFSRILAMSPSIWWNNRMILRTFKRLQPKPRLKVWLDIGGKEGDKHVLDAVALRDAMLNDGWTMGDDLAFWFAPEAVHNEGAWAERMGPALKFLFPRAGG
jgi:predicted alpha/beta superfamily hydrolase